MQGGLISIGDLKSLLKHSYKPKPHSFKDYEVDNDLSGKRAQVYKKRGTKEAVVVHRGTKGFQDLVTDVKLLFGANVRETKRYKHAQKIQDQAEAKYGSENVSTVGHSLGADIASKVGRKSKEVINFNKGVGFGKASPPNPRETNIRTQLDPVSALLTLGPYNNEHLITIKSESLNPFKEHMVDSLKRLDPHLMVGESGKRKRKLEDGPIMYSSNGQE